MSVYILTYYYFEPIIIWVIYFFWYWAAWAVCVFRRLIPYQLLCCKYFLPFFCCYCSLSRILLFVTPWTTAHQASQFFTISRACSNLCPSTWWCHPTISSSVVPFSSCPQSFPASESFLMSWLFASGGQSIGASPSASVLPMNIQDWCWSWNIGTLGTLWEELTHLTRPWCWERLRAGGEGDDKGWDGWMASLTQRTWVWAISRRWWWTGKPGVL